MNSPTLALTPNEQYIVDLKLPDFPATLETTLESAALMEPPKVEPPLSLFRQIAEPMIAFEMPPPASPKSAVAVVRK